VPRLRTKRLLSIASIVLVSGGAYLAVESRLDSPRTERVSVSPVGHHEQLRSSRSVQAPVSTTRARARAKAKAAPTTAKTTATTTPKPAPTVPPPPPPPLPAPPSVTPASLCTNAVGSIAWPPGWRASCEGSRAGLLGLTSPAGTSQIFMRSEIPASRYLLIALHEAGNAWDLARLNASDRVTWCAARGCDAAAFFAGPVHAGGWIEARGAEDWAESWQACHGAAYDRSYIGLEPPTATLCRLQLALVAS
jgi:hypothetical protein